MQHRGLLALVALLAGAQPVTASANVITDWDEIGVKTVQPIGAPPPINPGLFFRAMAMMHIAMFNAVNAIEPRYQPYKFQEQAEPEHHRKLRQHLLPPMCWWALFPTPTYGRSSQAISRRFPTARRRIVASSSVRMSLRRCWSCVLTTGRRHRTPIGRSLSREFYVPTAAMIGWECLTMTPFAMTSPSQFRPGPPVDLKSEQWAKDYNEIKELGEKHSTKRTARQTEDARFWLTTGPLSTHSLERQIVIGKSMSVLNSARFMAIVSVAEADAIQSVYEAKYYYNFWCPITAIRYGDIDGNSETERMPTWEPLDVTPMHPEYPCAHCIVSTAVATVIEAMIGGSDIPEVAITMPSAPGVTHHYTNLNAFTDEVANARIYAGFHYRTSTVVGRNMGREIGSYTVKTILQPLN